MSFEGASVARAAALAALLVLTGCGARPAADDAGGPGVVVVNAPAAGVVRRVLAREGMEVKAGDPLVEIAVAVETQAAPTPRGEDPQKRAAAGLAAAQAEIEAARAEVVRRQVEVQRLAPLVAAGQASQGELDGARALYERAQQRLRQAEDAAQRAQGGLVAARSQSQTPAGTEAPAPQERLVVARAASNGTVTAVSAREGRRVNAGQPLATLRAK
jgi:HlyD family secretion protein